MPKSSRQSGATPKDYRVFISHSSRDAWIARQIGKEIEAVGAKKWLDEHDLKGGDDVRNNIIAGIRACREVVLVLSPASVQSHWVSIEIGAALGQRKRVTPILNNVSATEMGPLQGIRALLLNEFDDFLVDLKRRLDHWTVRDK